MDGFFDAREEAIVNTNIRRSQDYFETSESETMNKYLVVIEKTRTGFSAFSPDVEGCAATGKTKSEVEKNMQEALEFHVEGLHLEGYPVPKPRSYSQYVAVRSKRLAGLPARKTTKVLRRSEVRAA